jgi:plasmid stability protein
MVKTQVYLREEELDALRMAAARSGRSVAELVRDAIRKIVLKPQPQAQLPSGTASRSVRPSNTTAFKTGADASRGSGFPRQWGVDRPRVVKGPMLRAAGAKLHSSVPIGHRKIHISRS